MSGIYIDTSELAAIQAALGATDEQARKAFARALKRTATALSRKAKKAYIKGTAVKHGTIVNGRVRTFSYPGKGGNLSGGRLWIGLDSLPVSALNGRIKTQKNRKPRRGANGRFIAGVGARAASFIPDSNNLPRTFWPKSFVAELYGKRTIWVRNSSGHIHEARVPIFDSMIGDIETNVFAGAAELLMKNFTNDLRGRVVMGIK